MSVPMTATQIIDCMFKRVSSEKHQVLVEIQSSRALGALMALCNLRLIDGPTCIQKGQELHALAEIRISKLSGVRA